MKKINLFTLCGTLFLFPLQAQKSQNRPNIIYILADDLGYGDIACYGQGLIKTPNLDKMAGMGMRFTQHYSGCTVSAPSRSSLMTGLHTGHTPIRGNKEFTDEGQYPLPKETFTIARMLHDAGYVTGAFGKWGLGAPQSEGSPNKQGFDEFFGYNCQRMAHRYYPTHIWHNEEKIILTGNDTKNKVIYAPDMIHEKALEFIRKNKDSPFFAYIPLIQPHAELLVPDDNILRTYEEKFVEIPFVSKGEGAEYGSLDYNVLSYCSQPKPRATFAAMVARIDKYVGEIIDLVKKLNIEENTLIIFTSDNGPHREGGADPDFFNSNGGFSGYKRDVTEGGIRVPMIAYWPRKISQGSVNNHISAFWDIMPTFAELVQTKFEKKIDGISMLPTLLGENHKQKKHDYLYWEFHEGGGRVAVRMGNWKAIRLNVKKNPNSKIELYNIVSDPKEQYNVADQHPDIIARVTQIMKESHTPNLVFPF